MMLVLLAGLAVLAGGTGFAQWQAGRFPARSEPIRGTPVELRVQDGVTARELGAVRRRRRVVQRYLRRTLGRGVVGPVEVRVARPDPLPALRFERQEVIGEGGAGFVCVDTGNVEWKVLISTHPPAATAVSAHEYVHVWQAELGACRRRRRREYRWIVEGMATDLAWRALVGGRVTEARVRRTIRRDGRSIRLQDPSRPTSARAGARRSTRSGSGDPLAPARRVERRARAGRQIALRAFCAGVGAGPRGGRPSCAASASRWTSSTPASRPSAPRP